MHTEMLVGILLLTFHFGQDQGFSRQPANNAKVQELIARIQKGNDSNALLEAGRTGNLEFVPHLRERLRHDMDKHNSLKRQAQMALAKLGQADQLQVIYCLIASGNDSQVDNTVGELDYVGGWYSIRILRAVANLELAANPRPDPRQHGAYDAQYIPAGWMAVNILARILPEASAKLAPGDELQIAFWKDYIPAHVAELKNLQPTGEGVDFSPRACKNGKPVKKY